MAAAGAALLGLGLFLLYCDPRIVLPGEIRWLMSGDPAQHFLGWQFFRNAPLLQFPLGANPLFGGEQGSSIVFTDSLPLLALLFKPLRALLPDLFQYQGAWILICFVLQPLFAFRLLGLFTRDRELRLLGALFFALAPPMLWRLHGHESLLAHWTLLAALHEYFSPRHHAGRWAALLTVTALVHGYLVAMAAAIAGADLVRRIRERELTWLRSAAEATTAAAGLLLLMWTVGYFVAGHGLSGAGYGLYRMNLLSPIDPDADWSLLLRDQYSVPGDYEGFNYLGIAVWGLLLAAAPRLLGADRPRLAWRRHAPLALLCLACSLFAISHRIQLGSHELLSMDLWYRAERLLNVFRASGRMFWPVVYVIDLAVLVLFCRSTGRRAAIRVLLVVLALQLVDLSRSMGAFRERFAASLTAAPALESDFWESAAARYRKVVVVPPRLDLEGIEPLVHFAAVRGLPINTAYSNRFDKEAVERASERLVREIRAARFDRGALYVFVDRRKLWNRVRVRAGGRDLVAVVDGFRVLAPGMKGDAQGGATKRSDGARRKRGGRLGPDQGTAANP